MRSSTATFLLAITTFGVPCAAHAASAYKAPDANPPAATQGGDVTPAVPAAPAATTAPAATDTITIAPDASSTTPAAATSADTGEAVAA